MDIGTGCRRAPPGRLLALAPPVPGEAARAELKAYLRVAGGDEDALLDRLLAVAAGQGEAFTGRLWLTRAASETLALQPGWVRLGATPVRAIGTVEVLDLAGTATALAAAAYALDIDAAGDGWLRATAAPAPARVRVGYQAGLAATWDGVPDPLRHGALRLAAHLYTHRDAADEGAPPAAVAALWRAWRRMRVL